MGPNGGNFSPRIMLSSKGVWLLDLILSVRPRTTQRSFLEIAGKPNPKFVAERQRTRQVIAHLRLGEFRLGLRDCIHDRRMIADDLSGLAADGKMQPADAIDVAAALADECPKVRHACGII